ncbi:unnamed protein product [Caenorhabditis bovis]|uniref:Uncharacterized protein n=1 Tax=Caenorhabditis bovis TaxID=2654633 RepID=A0A8S1EUV3_9PELO|nr:unnamed protein product [Caenorhabditis bovis]
MSTRRRRPTACFELLDVPRAAFATLILQILAMLLQLAAYFVLESRAYFLVPATFRMVIIPVATIYIGGAIVATFGVLTRRRLLVTIHSTITIALMVLTDILAVSIILLMAIGKRNAYLHQLPHNFINEKKFYDALGPFWMYLGAISLHITVAMNMAFLQPLNEFAEFVQSESQVAKSALASTYTTADKLH